MPEEYEYQSSIGTRKELSNLTNSQEYKTLLRKKGEGLEKWNWQVYESKQGNLQPNKNKDESKENDQDKEFDLVTEVYKVEEELKHEKGQSGYKRKQTQEKEQAFHKSLSSPSKITPHNLRGVKTPFT